jgi:hypothetical protein
MMGKEEYIALREMLEALIGLRAAYKSVRTRKILSEDLRFADMGEQLYPKEVSHRLREDSLEPISNLSPPPHQQRYERQYDHLTTGTQFSLTILPESPTFLQPRKRTLDDPAFRYHHERVERTSLHHFNFSVNDPLDAGSEFLSRVAAVNQHFLHGGKRLF